MKSSRIQSFISEAQRELSKITPQIEALTERRNSLQEVVTGGLKLLKKTGQPETSQPQSASTAVADIQRDHPAFSPKSETWEKIAQVLKQTGRPMMPSEIVKGMEQLGTPISGKFPRDSVRSAMNRKPNIFERMGQGWGLRTWGAEMKQSKQQQPRVQVQ